jgi:large subunit ribosomal protein L17
MLRNMATSVFECGAITTTIFKAKALKPIIDQLITLAKKGDLSAIRKARTILTKPSVVKELFSDAKEKYSDRVCGYATMAKVGLRAGDAAPMARLELIGPDYQKAETGKTTRKTVDRSRRVAATKKKSLNIAPAGTEALGTDAIDAATKSALDSALDTSLDSALDSAIEAANASANESANESASDSEADGSSEPKPDDQTSGS